MPSFGGLSPYPRSLGGDADDLLLALTESIHRGRGSSAPEEETSNLWLESTMIARAIWGLYGTNERLARMWNPLSMPLEILNRWVSILSVRLRFGETDASKRARIQAKWDVFGTDIDLGYLNTIIANSIGSFFVGIDPISLSVASQTVPDATYPWGIVLADAPWTSTTFHLLVYVTKPTGYSEQEFYDTMATLTAALDPVLPAWMTFDWYRAPSPGAPVNVSGGPRAGGFYLDDATNLDNEVFDV